MPLEILNDLKKNRKLTFEEIAAQTGESVATIRRIFSGAEPRWDTMCKLAVMFDVPLDFFRDQRDPKIIRQSELRHVARYRAIDPPKKAQVDTLLNHLYEEWEKEMEKDPVVTMQHRLTRIQATASYSKLCKILEYAEALDN